MRNFGPSPYDTQSDMIQYRIVWHPVPLRPWYVERTENFGALWETERFGVPYGKMPRSFKTVAAAERALSKLRSRA